MEAEIEVLQPGLFSSIQDLGRFGFQKYGVPQSGVMDRYAMRICNLILGNSENSAVLEITLQGPHLKFKDPTSIVISGADLSAQINGQTIPMNERVKVKAGDELKFGMPRSGFRAYLGILGGFISEDLLESKSWYEGLTENFRLKKGMHLFYSSKDSVEVETFSSLKIDSVYMLSKEIEVYPGPEFDKLPVDQHKILFNSDFTIEETSNRMAIQFKEDFENELQPIITGPVMPG
ncbi:MAG: allophanate hydrolase subunit 2 family protein, partial [Gramella sp.]|nr:allophanate hydrolase subunit 2 family protein [Christiangramia sp.]